MALRLPVRWGDRMQQPNRLSRHRARSEATQGSAPWISVAPPGWLRAARKDGAATESRRSPHPQFRTLPSGPTLISCSLSAPATLISYWTAEPSFSTSAS